MRRAEKPCCDLRIGTATKVGARDITVSSNSEGDRDFEETNSRLSTGLKSCRKVLNNYRSLLSPKPEADWTETRAGLESASGPAAAPDPIES